MGKVNLTRPIDNDNGYIDSVINEIQAIKDGELYMNITCHGGDVDQGARLEKAVLQFQGKTIADVTGCAYSMAGVLLSCFDHVKADEESEIMLHKAHYPSVNIEDYSQAMYDSCSRFNQRAYNRMIDGGVNNELANQVFLSETTNDFYLTAEQAKKMGIVDEVVEVKRAKPVLAKVAAKLFPEQNEDYKKKYNDYKLKQEQMLGFGKSKKDVVRVAKLSDGRQLVFNSAADNLEKGCEASLIGSNEVLNGKYKLENNLYAMFSEGVVEDIGEGPSEEPSQIEMIAKEVEEMKAAIKTIMEKIGGSEQPSPEASKEVEEKMESKYKEMENAVAQAKEAAAQASAVSAKFAEFARIQNNFVPTKVEDKREPIMNGLSEKEARAYRMNQIAKGNIKLD